jgi:hypothetical protein
MVSYRVPDGYQTYRIRPVDIINRRNYSNSLAHLGHWNDPDFLICPLCHKEFPMLYTMARSDDEAWYFYERGEILCWKDYSDYLAKNYPTILETKPSPYFIRYLLSGRNSGKDALMKDLNYPKYGPELGQSYSLRFPKRTGTEAQKQVEREYSGEESENPRRWSKQKDTVFSREEAKDIVIKWEDKGYEAKILGPFEFKKWIHDPDPKTRYVVKHTVGKKK